MKKQFIISSLEQLTDVAQQLLSSCTDRKVFAFLGEMGAGKTTVIHALCRAIGVTGHLSSPTFSIVNEYHGREPVYHIDLYRLKSMHEALEIGIEEYLSGQAYCFIEWPQVIEALLPETTVKISIEGINEHQRILTLEKV